MLDHQTSNSWYHRHVYDRYNRHHHTHQQCSRHTFLKAGCWTFIFILLLLTCHDKNDTSRTIQKIKQRHDGDNDDLVLLPSLIEKSAFPSNLYHNLQFPYTHYECQPHKLHISPASNVDYETNTMNMTISFALNHIHCSPTDGGGLEVSIIYGRGMFPDGRVVYTPNNNNDRNNDFNNDFNNSTIVQFDFVSSVTGEHYHSDWIYHVVISNLQAGRQQYWYRIIVCNKQEGLVIPPPTTTISTSNALLPSSIMAIPYTQQSSLNMYLRGSRILGQTPIYHFRTPPMAGKQSTSIAFVGDLGQTENSTKTMHYIYQASVLDNNDILPPITLFVIAGDLSYADGEPKRWETWLELMEPLLRRVPFISVPGNHEIECDNITHNVFVPYEHWFRNPNRLKPWDMIPPKQEYINSSLWNHQCNAPSQFLGHYNYGNAFYQYTHGLVHIIALNSYTSIVKGSPQYEWLTQIALPQVNRDVTPWLIVTFHCPLYTTFLGHNNEINPTSMKQSIEELLHQYQVNIVVSGHDHAYLRTKPIHNGHVDPSGRSPTYWTLGAGGNREQHTRGYIHEKAEEWVAIRDNGEYGYGHFFAPNANFGHLQWIRDGTSPQDKIRDSIWIENYYFPSSEKLIESSKIGQ